MSLTRDELQNAADLLRELAANVDFATVEHLVDCPEELDILIARLDAAAYNARNVGIVNPRVTI